MKEKSKAIVGHLVFAGLFFLGLAVVPEGRYFTPYLIGLFIGIGLWAAVGSLRSFWFSFSFALVLWFIIGATVLVTFVISHPPDTNDDKYWYVFFYFMAAILMGAGFTVGRTGVAIVRSFSKQHGATIEEH